MKFLGKIDAIKALRTLIMNMKIETPTVKVEDNLIKVQMTAPYIGLKEAKDFIEAVMEVAERPTTFYKLTRVSKMGGRIHIQPEVIGFYGSLAKATERMNFIMALKAYNDVWEDERDYLTTSMTVEY